MKTAGPTLRDVADAAGVSIATISRVLNKSSIPTEETKAQVLKAAESLNYILQKPGRKGGGSKKRVRLKKTIGLLLSSVVMDRYTEEPYYARLLRGIYQAVGNTKYHLMIDTYNVHDNQQPVPIIQDKVDGLLIDDEIPDAIQAFLSERLPVVFIDRSPRKVRASEVRPNFEIAVFEILDYLWKLGHRDIAFFVPKSDYYITSLALNAYKEFFVEKEYSPRVGELNVPRSIKDNSHEKVIRQYAEELLQASTRPTAVISQDVYALGIMSELTKQGLKLPQEMSFVGINDSSLALHARPLLTSYRFPMDAMGQTAVEVLLQKIADPTRPHRQIQLDGEIITRDSVVHRPVNWCAFGFDMF